MNKVTKNITKAVGKSLKPKKIEDGKDLRNRVFTVGFYGLVGFLGYRWGLRPLIIKWKRKAEEGKVLDDPNKKAAVVLYNAMNPSGIKWMFSLDTTNTPAVLNAASTIKDWKNVQSSYKKLYDRNLLEDLQSELSTDDLNTFMTRLDVSSNQTTYSSRSNMIIAAANIRIRKTPDSTISAYSVNSNILGVLVKSSFLGFATGKQHVDTAGVKYIQVAIKFVESIPKAWETIYQKLGKSNIMVFWVGLGAVLQFTDIEQIKKDVPDLRIYKGTKNPLTKS